MNQIKRIKEEIGIILCMFGIPIASVINEFLKGIKITNLLLLVSLILLFDFGGMKKVKINKAAMFLFVFQTYIVFIAIIEGQSLFEESRGLIYTFFMIVVIVVVSFKGKTKYPEHFVSVGWWILGLFNALLFLYLTNWGTSLRFQGATRLTYGADRLTLSKLAFSFLIFELLRGKYTKRNVVDFLFTAFTLYNVLFCNRRSSIIFFLVVCLLHFTYYREKSNRINLKTYMNAIRYIIVIGVLILLIVKLVPNASETATYYWDSIIRAINTLRGYTSADESAMIRNNLRQQAYIELKGASFGEMLFGRGYMYRYLDFPFLQAFVDMGIFGIAYVLIQAIIPIKYWINRYTNVAERLFQYYSIFLFFENFTAGVPYGYGKFVSLIFLFYQVSPAKHNYSVHQESL